MRLYFSDVECAPRAARERRNGHRPVLPQIRPELWAIVFRAEFPFAVGRLSVTRDFVFIAIWIPSADSVLPHHHPAFSSHIPFTNAKEALVSQRQEINPRTCWL
jgi:hypothetical protein